MEELLKAYQTFNRAELTELGKDIGRLYTDHGLPLDMSIERLRPMCTEDQVLLIVDGACQWFMQHKRNSGATETALERQRKTNVSILNNVIHGKETGIY